MDDGGRQCALPGCDRTITIADGRPERRYCTAAHRAAARQARRAAMQAEQRGGPNTLAETLPWLREPADDRADAAESVPRPSARSAVEITAGESGVVVRRPRERRRDPARPRRALAMLGVAGILAGGYAATDARQEPPTPALAAPETADVWAEHATVALASVNSQLDDLARAEDEWKRLPESRRVVVPAPMTVLAERRSVLQQRRAALQSQLDTYRSLRRAQQELAVSEQHLRAVEKALADAPPRRSAEQDAAVAALDEQRDLRIRQRDAQRAELASLEDGMSTATRTPLPDDGSATAKVSREVREVVRHGGGAPTRPADPSPPRPDVVTGREQEDGKPRQEVPTSGPPDPRGPRDETEERRAASPSVPEAGRDEPRRNPGGPGEPEAPAEPGAGSADDGGRAADGPRDVLAELRERVTQAAREARKAEAARKAAPPRAGPGRDAGLAEPPERTGSGDVARGRGTAEQSPAAPPGLSEAPARGDGPGGRSQDGTGTRSTAPSSPTPRRPSAAAVHRHTGAAAGASGRGGEPGRRSSAGRERAGRERADHPDVVRRSATKGGDATGKAADARDRGRSSAPSTSHQAADPSGVVVFVVPDWISGAIRSHADDEGAERRSAQHRTASPVHRDSSRQRPSPRKRNSSVERPNEAVPADDKPVRDPDRGPANERNPTEEHASPTRSKDGAGEQKNVDARDGARQPGGDGLAKRDGAAKKRAAARKSDGKHAGNGHDAGGDRERNSLHRHKPSHDSDRTEDADE